MSSSSRPLSYRLFFPPRASTDVTVVRKNCLIRWQKAGANPDSQLRVGGHLPKPEKRVGEGGDERIQKSRDIEDSNANDSTMVSRANNNSNILYYIIQYGVIVTDAITDIGSTISVEL